MHRFLYIVPLIAIILMAAPSVFALSIPDFPNCPFPGGEQIANYDSGFHGVPGDNNTYTGADQVYRLNENQVVQCLCTEEGQGVQSWWWKQPGVTAEEEGILNKQGWVRVPNGALWGLDSTIWFAKNTYYSCKGDLGRGGVLGISNGRILGATTLADTGSYGKIAGYLALGLAALLIRNRLRRAH